MGDEAQSVGLHHDGVAEGAWHGWKPAQRCWRLSGRRAPMTPREKDIVFYILVAIVVFVMLYVGIGSFIDTGPKYAE
jgi:hypothetical protein